MGKYLLAIDQGTSSTRSVLYDDKRQFIDSSQLEFKQYFPQEGWVEHNPEENLGISFVYSYYFGKEK